MQAYQTNLINNSNAKEIFCHIIKNCNKTQKIKIWKICIDSVDIGFTFNNKDYEIKIFIENKKPIYIFTNIDTKSKSELELCEKINLLNLDIGLYERLEDIFFDIVTIVNESDDVKTLGDTDETITKTKNIEEFKKLIEQEKKLIKKTEIVSKVLSPDSIIEMLGDQLIKLHLNDNFVVKINGIGVGNYFLIID